MLRHAIVLAVLAATPALADPTYITFQVPGSHSTTAEDINAAGDVVGTYVIEEGSPKTFIRHADGAFETFDDRNPIAYVAINDRGDIAGTKTPVHGDRHGFLRRFDGTVRTIKILGTTTWATALSSTGEVAGYTEDSDLHARGFLYDGNRQYVRFELPGPRGLVSAVNGAGTVAGVYHGSEDGVFIRSKDGSFTTFTFDNPSPAPTVADMNEAGQVTGNVGTADGSGSYGDAFILSADAPAVFFRVGKNPYTAASGINAHGTVVGHFRNRNTSHGFVRTRRGTIKAFDCPNGFDTTASAINDSGVIAGTYIDNDARISGFIRFP